MIAFVTGGCGFVGRHLTKRLLADGYAVWLLDNLSVGLNPSEWLPDGFADIGLRDGLAIWRRGEQEVVFIKDDALHFFPSQLQLGQARKLINLPVFNSVYHLASVVGGRAVIEEDPMAVAIDLAIDAAFFRWVVKEKEKVGRVLYTSSSAAYPVDLQIEGKARALKEEYIDFSGSLGVPDMTYGWSKLTGEYLARVCARYYGVPVACVRPFSGYGGDQDQTYPIPAIARRAAQREDPLIVWGTGRQGRDFVHIDDCIEAMIRTLREISDGGSVNIGTGVLTNFLEIAEIFTALAGYKPDIKPLIDEPEGVGSRYSDTTRMKEVLKWEPSIDLREGLERVLREQRQALGVKPPVRAG